jgi:hypothetical protein
MTGAGKTVKKVKLFIKIFLCIFVLDQTCGRDISSDRDDILQVSLELGGNAPCIIFNDANLDIAVKGAVCVSYCSLSFHIGSSWLLIVTLQMQRGYRTAIWIVYDAQILVDAARWQIQELGPNLCLHQSHSCARW